MSEIAVSISCLVYNHENYLRRCLDGFLSQKTNFAFEILIHDDASTDSSADIIREYEAKYPDIVKPIYQTENQYSKKVNMHFTYQYPRARGKYFCVCEGDDYWCDDTKLQKQFDVMEAHPEVALCVHRVQTINEAGEPRAETLPSYPLETGLIPGRELVTALLGGQTMPFQMSSYCYRTAHYQHLDPIPAFMSIAVAGDMARVLYLADLGDVYFIDETMSCYRVNSVGSWSSRTNRDVAYKSFCLNNLIELYRLYDEHTDGRYRDSIENIIEVRTFSLLKNEFRIKEMRSARFKARFKAMPFAERMCYRVAGILPFTKPLVRRLRERMRSL